MSLLQPNLLIVKAKITKLLSSVTIDAEPKYSKMEFNLDSVLYRFNGTENFTIRQACEGVQIFGGIGSGKTSGSGAALAKSYLRAGFGGLVLCAKKDELDTWKRYAEETGRSKSLLIFDVSGKFTFPFLQYEVSRKGEGAGNTANLVRLFSTVHEAMEKSSGGGGSDPYWNRAMEQLLRNAIDLSLLARGEVSVPVLYDIIMSAPRTTEQRDSEEWRESSFCWKLLTEANQRKRTKWEQYDFDSTVTYWLEEFATLPPKLLSSIVSIFTSIGDNFMRRPFRMLFAENPEDKKKILYPEYSQKGAVIILNMPVKEFGAAGRTAQIVYKYMWQQAVERRNTQESPTPVFLWVDEAQNFATEYDMQFQATARSSRACTVYLTQNLANYYAEMGGTHSKYRVDSLIGNLQTKIWHSNSEPETNSAASETIGKSWQTRFSTSESVAGGGFTMGQSEQHSFDYDVIPQAFTKLRKGARLNNYKVEAYIFQNGRVWSNGKTNLKAIFKQR